MISCEGRRGKGGSCFCTAKRTGRYGPFLLPLLAIAFSLPIGQGAGCRVQGAGCKVRRVPRNCTGSPSPNLPLTARGAGVSTMTCPPKSICGRIYLWWNLALGEWVPCHLAESGASTLEASSTMLLMSPSCMIFASSEGRAGRRTAEILCCLEEAFGALTFISLMILACSSLSLSWPRPNRSGIPPRSWSGKGHRMGTRGLDLLSLFWKGTRFPAIATDSSILLAACGHHNASQRICLSRGKVSWLNQVSKTRLPFIKKSTGPTCQGTRARRE